MAIQEIAARVLLTPSPSLAGFAFLLAAVFLIHSSIQKLLRRIPKRRDVESPATPQLKATSEKGNLPTPEVSQALSEPKLSTSETRQLNHYKSIYHKVQNLETYPTILPEARAELIALLSLTLSTALNTPSDGILSVSEFSREGLEAFLKHENDTATSQFEAYMARRRNGSPMEIFSDQAEGKWWLKQAAPV